jgi:hypothetical protein
MKISALGYNCEACGIKIADGCYTAPMRAQGNVIYLPEAKLLCFDCLMKRDDGEAALNNKE